MRMLQRNKNRCTCDQRKAIKIEKQNTTKQTKKKTKKYLHII